MNKKNVIISISLLLILTFSTISVADTLARNAQQQSNITNKQQRNILGTIDYLAKKKSPAYDFDIIIIYDSTNEPLTFLARHTLFLIRTAYPFAELLPAENMQHVKEGLSKGASVAVLIFNSTTEGVLLGEEIIGWEEFAKSLYPYYSTEIIFALGNTYNLDEYKLSNWHYGVYEYTGLSSLEIFVGWTVAEIMGNQNKELENVSKELKAITVKTMAENLNLIFEDNVNPNVRVGVKDEGRSSKALENYLAMHPNTMSLEKVDADGKKSDKPLLIGFVGLEPLGNGVELLPMPSLSGLKGPVGEFVDKVLNFLISQGASALGVNDSFINSFLQTFGAIKDFVGDPSKLGDGSALKNFLKTIASQIPIAQNYTKYINLVIDGFFALRGDVNDIMDFIIEAINAFVPSNTSTLVKVLNATKDLFDIGTEIANELGSISDKTIEVILKIVLDKLSNKTILATINETLSPFPSMQQYVGPIAGNITLILSIALDLLTVKNVTQFVDRLYDAIVNKLKLVNDPKLASTMDKVRNVLKLAILIAQKGEFDFKQLLKSVITSFVDESYISDVEKLVKDLVSELDKAVKEADGDIIAFGTRVYNIINNYISSTDPLVQKGKEYIKNITSFIGILANSNFSIDNVDSILTTIQNILDDYLSSTSPAMVYTDGGYHATGLSPKTIIMKVLNATIMPMILNFKNSRIMKAFLKLKDIDYSQPYDKIVTNVLDVIEMIINETNPSFDFTQIREKIEYGARIATGIIQVIGESKDTPYPSLLRTIVMVAGYSIKEVFGYNISIGNITKFLEAVLPRQMGLDKEPNYEEAARILRDALADLVNDTTVTKTIDILLYTLLELKDIYENGIDFIITKVLEWVAGKVGEFVQGLLKDLESLINNFAFLDIHGDTNIAIGGVDALTFKYSILLKANFEIDSTFIVQDIKDIVTKGKVFEILSPERQFENLLKAITIKPVFQAEFELKTMFSDDNELMQKVIEALGVSINIEGAAKFKMILFSFSSGGFDTGSFLKVEEWFFRFGVEISKTFTLLDLFGAGSLNAIAKYIGLDAITITLTLGFALEIMKGTSSYTGGETTTLTLELSIAGTLHIGLDVVIAKLIIDMTLKIVFRFLVDVVAPNPLRFIVDVTYNIKVHVELFFVGHDFTFGGNIFHYEYPNPTDSPESLAGGWDKDSDGLSDEFEKTQFGLSQDRKDTDNDGISDNEEVNGYGTDPIDPDTDGDGLNDYEEIMTYKTNPFVADTDNDKLSDYQEVKIYGTNPREADTDADGLDDYFEINHPWDISKVTTSVKEVIIGGKTYYDRTDPLNPDTDGDGLLDGQEGPMGGYYGDKAYDFGKNPIIFNDGYLHPLDNDTDDDSYVQLADGRIATPKTFLMPMTDKNEIDGITVVFIEDGEPVLKTFRTSPVSPDTDQDTGTGAVFLNGDGYELSLDPPSDPLDGDTDDDGLIDGNEGVGNPTSNKTHYLLPDSDYDGLGDLQEIILGTDPRNPDSDYDLVSDGDEYLKYGTNPLLDDSDFDGLYDGEELFFFHSNPMLTDSDGDGLSDGEEALIYFTDPMDEDTDNDNLTDRAEILIHHTNPIASDSDYDGIIDGEEVYIYKTDPLNWDSDGDSILYPNENGEYTWTMSDGEEVFVYGTNPLVRDTDNDGIDDGMELYLASGLIPNFDPIPLNVLNNDTDGDGLLDGIELRIRELPDIVYPYVSFNLTTPFNTSPLLPDTDGDGLSDYEEVVNYTTLADNVDTDGDNLTDYDEIFVYNTSPTNPDTDYDNITDYDEIFGNVSTPAGMLKAIGTLDPLDNDTDDDNLMDGYELYTVGTDPTNPDSDGDGLSDGYEFDSDEDGLSDGEEFELIVSKTGKDSVNNPDIDNDGLNDGDEVKIYHTDPTNPDSDGDGITDGAEVAVGTDPNSPTDPEEYNLKLSQRLQGYVLVLLTPQGQTTDRFVDVRVLNGTAMESVWFRYSKGDGFSENYTMIYSANDKQWVYNNITWEDGSYTIEVYGKSKAGEIYSYTTTFTIGPTPTETPFWVWLAIGIVAGMAIIFAFTFVLPRFLRRRTGSKNPIKNNGGKNVEQ